MLDSLSLNKDLSKIFHSTHLPRLWSAGADDIIMTYDVIIQHHIKSLWCHKLKEKKAKRSLRPVGRQKETDQL